MRFMWPAINKRSHLGFSNLFDDYPDRIDTTKSVSFLRAKVKHKDFLSSKHFILKSNYFIDSKSQSFIPMMVSVMSGELLDNRTD